MGLTRDELILVTSLIEDYYDEPYRSHATLTQLIEARRILKREVKLKTINPVKSIEAEQ